MLRRNNILRISLLLHIAICLPLNAQKASLPVKPGTVKGIVSNSVTGEPVVRAHVVFNGFSGGSVYGAMTTSDGRFSMLSIPPGTYSVAAIHRGYQPSTNFPSAPSITIKSGEDATDVVVKLVPSAVISGQVVDVKDQPMPNVSVEAIGEDSSGSTLSDDHGRFRVAGLSSARFLVKAKNNGILPPEIRTDGTVQVNYGTTYYPSAVAPESAVPVQTQAGRETADIIIKMKPAPLVRVSGTIAGVPPGDMRISLSLGSVTSSSSVPLDPLNRFTLWGLDSGRHTLFANSYSENKPLSGSSTFYLADTNVDNLVVAVMPSFALNGKISTTPTLSKADQEAWPAQDRKLLMMLAVGIANPVAAITIDIEATGDFKVPTLWPARYRFSLRGFPESMYVKDVESGTLKLDNGVLDLNNGPPNQPLTIELGADGGQITGQVLDSNNKPAFARIGLLTRNSSGYSLVQQAIAFNGPYSFTGLPPGKYFLQCQQNWGSGTMSPEEFAALFSGMLEEVEVGPGEKVKKDLKLPDAFQ